ncbi:RebB family R body protein [Photobacterium lipolyticum]|uniref:Glycerol-3-phosphate dehydrogenase n=1 Tax=Photobacterium lipolyticum TaxID=266810 RepID=A0A2T3N415_9GAMM|nr:RebB family R body protein [Photobacterium lipolyticum]PSW07160.1 glycerol-3-phosphate dehydrogenase [Photobacterium lipolyticum]
MVSVNKSDDGQSSSELLSQVSPDVSRGMLYQSTAHALSNAVHNATFLQQQQSTLFQSTTAMGVSLIEGLAGAAIGKG